MSKTIKRLFIVLLISLIFFLFIKFVIYHGQEGKMIMNKTVNVYSDYPSGGSPLQNQDGWKLAVVKQNEYCCLYEGGYQKNCSLDELNDKLPFEERFEKIRDKTFYLVFNSSSIVIKYKNDSGIARRYTRNREKLAEVIGNKTPEDILHDEELRTKIFSIIKDVAIGGCYIIESLNKGEVVDVIGIRYGKDRMFYKVRLKDGRKGFIMYEGHEETKELAPCTQIFFC
jgi:hypothetical protein